MKHKFQVLARKFIESETQMKNEISQKREKNLA